MYIGGKWKYAYVLLIDDTYIYDVRTDKDHFSRSQIKFGYIAKLPDVFPIMNP